MSKSISDDLKKDYSYILQSTYIQNQNMFLIIIGLIFGVKH